MGLQQSKDELLYQQVTCGNTEGIENLYQEGAGLEWTDKEGKTPLILACLNPELYDVAKTLIELGANIDAYRPGRNGGTALHHAAKRGLDNTVKLLLSHGANALIKNDDFQTPLQVARAKGHSNVVRTIENHICLFSGWMREFYEPGFLEVPAQQFLSRNVWVAVLPTGSRNNNKPFKLELAIYHNPQDAQPRTVIKLWKANVEEPKFHHSDPSVIVDVESTIRRGRRRRRARHRPQTITQTRIKLAPENEGDKQQFQSFCDACKGIPQAIRPAFMRSLGPSAAQATAPPAESLESAMVIDTSIQSSTADAPITSTSPIEPGGSSSGNDPENTKILPVAFSIHQNHIHNDNILAVQAPGSSPSAPPVIEDIIDDGLIQYPSIDCSPVDMISRPDEEIPASSGEKNEEGDSSCCVICLDARVEGACIPCGHMAGCMLCLNEVKAKKWGCPVCRAKINQVVKLYAV